MLFGVYLMWRGDHLDERIGLVLIAVGLVAAYINDAQQVRHDALLAALKPKQLNEIDPDEPQFTIHEDYAFGKDNETRTIFPNRFRYEQSMWSGDWMHKSVFEYAVKEKRQVFERCIDDFRIDRTIPQNPQYDFNIVNGEVVYKPDYPTAQFLETLHESVLWRTPKDLQTLQRSVVWHEVKDSELKWFILFHHLQPNAPKEIPKEMLAKFIQTEDEYQKNRTSRIQQGHEEGSKNRKLAGERALAINGGVIAEAKRLCAIEGLACNEYGCPEHYKTWIHDDSPTSKMKFAAAQRTAEAYRPILLKALRDAIGDELMARLGEAEKYMYPEDSLANHFGVLAYSKLEFNHVDKSLFEGLPLPGVETFGRFYERNIEVSHTADFGTKDTAPRYGEQYIPGDLRVIVGVQAGGYYPDDRLYQINPTADNFLKELVNIHSLFASTTVLTASPNPSKEGQPVKFTATVVSAGRSDNPVGKVTFKDSSTETTLGHLTLNAGMASLTTCSLAAGTHNITATYDGDDWFSGDGSVSGSSHAAISQVVNGLKSR